MTVGMPLVSVLMPAYNVQGSIGYAIASLLSQSYNNWECIVVDDGSTDDTIRLLRAIAAYDSRVKVFSFKTNQGRGAARIKTLKEAKGDYITMLDADDWLYPHKIERQVRFLESNPDVSLHSMGMAITDGSGLVSKRGVPSDVKSIFDQLVPIFIPHAPSMIRRSDIGDQTYDRRLKLAQDQDFIRRVLVGNRYVVSPALGYTYSEMGSVSISKVLRGYAYNAFGYYKLRSHFGLKASYVAFKELSKIPFVGARFILQGREAVLKGRSSRVQPEDELDFLNAKQIIDKAYQDLKTNEVLS